MPFIHSATSMITLIFSPHNKTVSFNDIIVSRSTHMNETSTNMSERESSVTASDDLLCKKGGSKDQTPNKEHFAKYVRKRYLLKAETQTVKFTRKSKINSKTQKTNVSFILIDKSKECCLVKYKVGRFFFWMTEAVNSREVSFPGWALMGDCQIFVICR